MTTASIARSPRQLDIIADTLLCADHKNRTDLSTARDRENRTDLSTAPKNKNRTDLSTARAKRIAATRRQLGVSTSALATAAGVHLQTYFAMVKNPGSTRPATIEAFERALDRFAAGHTLRERLTIGEASLRGLIIDIALRLDLDPEAVLAQDYSSEKTNDPIYMQNCQVRRYAVYLMIEGMRFPKAAVARIARFSRQAAHKTVTAIEERRQGDAALDKLLGDMMLKVRGERL